MEKSTSLGRTLLAAATSGLVAGLVLLTGLGVGPLVKDALAAPPAKDSTCDKDVCKSKSARFDELSAKKSKFEGDLVSAGKTELKGGLVSRSKTDLLGATRLSGPTELAGNTRLKGPTTADSTLTVKKDLTVEDDLVVRGDLQVKGDLQVLGRLEIKGKMSFPSKEVSCVDSRTGDRKDKVCPIGDFSLCVPTHQSGICDLSRAKDGNWTLSARNPRAGMSPSMCNAVCW